MRESKIEAYLVKQVKALGGEVRKVQWVGHRGAPDRLVMVGDRFVPRRPLPRWIQPLTVWVELKATGVAPEAHQLREHDRMRMMGQWVEVIDSCEAVDRLLGVA